ADDEPFGVSNAQLHDEGSLTNLNNNQNTFCIIVDGNGHVNEDGTLYTHTNEDIIPQNLHPGENVLYLNNNNVSETVFDNLTWKLKTIFDIRILCYSIESDHDAHSNNSSEEEDAIIGSENGSESNDEYDSTNENEKENEIIKNTQNVNYHAQTNDQINQINGADEEHTRRDTVLEIQENVSVSSEDDNQITTSAIV
ncbi:unnamed protein product, partial [Rotaria sp. Silwood2]